MRNFQSPDENLKPSFVLSEVLRENTNRNLDVVMTLREIIEKLEKKAMAKPSKTVMNEVFTLKKQIAKFYRLLWDEQQMLGSLKNGGNPKH